MNVPANLSSGMSLTQLSSVLAGQVFWHEGTQTWAERKQGTSAPFAMRLADGQDMNSYTGAEMVNVFPNAKLSPSG